ncbi:hypothetical protein SPLC1_S260170 [Arthrospira platensis C1]|nr:hypothetical protein SPLC1_S260170 [Arthrospira platensis C1]
MSLKDDQNFELGWTPGVELWIIGLWAVDNWADY